MSPHVKHAHMYSKGILSMLAHQNSNFKSELVSIIDSQSLDGGVNVIQLETAAGAAIKNFTGAVGEYVYSHIRA